MYFIDIIPDSGQFPTWAVIIGADVNIDAETIQISTDWVSIEEVFNRIKKLFCSYLFRKYIEKEMEEKLYNYKRLLEDIAMANGSCNMCNFTSIGVVPFPRTVPYPPECSDSSPTCPSGPLQDPRKDCCSSSVLCAEGVEVEGCPDFCKDARRSGRLRKVGNKCVGLTCSTGPADPQYNFDQEQCTIPAQQCNNIATGARQANFVERCREHPNLPECSSEKVDEDAITSGWCDPGHFINGNVFCREDEEAYGNGTCSGPVECDGRNTKVMCEQPKDESGANICVYIYPSAFIALVISDTSSFSCCVNSSLINII